MRPAPQGLPSFISLEDEMMGDLGIIFVGPFLQDINQTLTLTLR